MAGMWLMNWVVLHVEQRRTLGLARLHRPAQDVLLYAASSSSLMCSRLKLRIKLLSTATTPKFRSRLPFLFPLASVTSSSSSSIRRSATTLSAPLQSYSRRSSRAIQSCVTPLRARLDAGWSLPLPCRLPRPPYVPICIYTSDPY